MKIYKIFGKKTSNGTPITDYRTGEEVWDGKAKEILLTYGDEFTMKHMYNSMLTYIDKSEWKLKLVCEDQAPIKSSSKKKK